MKACLFDVFGTVVDWRSSVSRELAACRHLGLPPGEVMMVAAHNADLKAAKAQGLATAFVPRPIEHGPGQTSDLAADRACVDVAAASFPDLASRLGC